MRRIQSEFLYGTTVGTAPPVVEDTALHGRVWLDAPGEVARGAEQRCVEVLLGTQERLGHGRLQQSLGQPCPPRNHQV